MRMLWLLGLMLLVGCEPAADRCRRILYEQAVGSTGGPPPRPSDQAWYAEHCWNGKPR